MEIKLYRKGMGVTHLQVSKISQQFHVLFTLYKY